MKRLAMMLLAVLALTVVFSGFAEAPDMVQSVIIPDGDEQTLPGSPLLPVPEAAAAENGEPLEATAPAEADETAGQAGALGETEATETTEAIEGAEPAETAETAETAGATGAHPADDTVQAPPVGDPRVPVWDDTTQQAAGQPPFGGEDGLTPGSEGEVPSVIMTLQKPVLPLDGVKIGIDPGHQARGNSEKETVAPNSSQTKAKVSSGTSGAATHIAEYITVLEISLKLRDALEEQGAEVYMTRETHDVNISNQERAKLMNGYGVDLVLRVHCDGVNNRSKHGIALYCSRSNSIAEESYRAAEAILPAVCASTGAKNNGIVSNDNYTGQNWSTVPCIMVECGFMSNPEEDRLLNDEAYQQKLAEGLTQGIIDYIALRDGM